MSSRRVRGGRPRDEAARVAQTASGTVLVHITHGPEHPTRTALGFAVARTAVEAGHEGTAFLAGDGVQPVRAAVRRDLEGLPSPARSAIRAPREAADIAT